tara:strand:+ start:11793 stop:12935 length:1143 start_codon:yes stop_codon:yes gene_type:complete
MKHKQEIHRIVVKVGTNVLTDGTESVSSDTVANIAREIELLRRDGVQVVLVTSGAITEGRSLLEGSGLYAQSSTDASTTSKQVLAALGQIPLMKRWVEAFDGLDILTAQILITRRDVQDRLSYLHARNTILNLLDTGSVPVVNENDVLATDEIADVNIGDNDHLSALIANLIDADLLVILSDVDGLYDSDPFLNPEAELISHVDHVDEYILSVAGSANERGRGGMASKVNAARIAMESGTSVLITNGKSPGSLVSAVTSNENGTYFQSAITNIESRRRYLLSEYANRGVVVVDDGASRALSEGASLLPVGLVESSGAFERGDVVEVRSEGGDRLAVGIINYSSEDAKQICGIQSEDIMSVLGYEYGHELIHRNNMVVIST